MANGNGSGGGNRFVAGLLDPRFWLSVISFAVIGIVGYVNMANRVAAIDARSSDNLRKVVDIETSRSARNKTQDSLTQEMRFDIDKIRTTQAQSYELLRAIAEKNGIWVPPQKP